MTWVTLALLTYFLWACTNIGEKYLVANKISRPVAYLLLGFWTGSLAILVFPFLHFTWPDAKTAAFLFGAAVLYFAGAYLYVRTLQIEEISRINLWWNAMPLFSLLIAWLILEENLTIKQLAAFAIIMVGVILASIHVRGAKLTLSRGGLFMLVACFLFSAHDVIVRQVTRTVPYGDVFLTIAISLLLLSFLPLFDKRVRLQVAATFKEISWRTIFLLAGINVVIKLGILTHSWAISLGPVALVNALEGFQSVFVFVLAFLLSWMFPRVIKEETDRRNLILKIIALAMMIVGVILV